MGTRGLMNAPVDTSQVASEGGKAQVTRGHFWLRLPILLPADFEIFFVATVTFFLSLSAGDADLSDFGEASESVLRAAILVTSLADTVSIALVTLSLGKHSIVVRSTPRIKTNEK